MILLNKTSYEIKNNVSTGQGVFATKDIPYGTIIADYIGKIITNESADIFPSLHCIQRNSNEVILPDLDKPGAHTINHSCSANCTYYPYKGHVVAVSKRKIFSGEEITTEYHVEPGYFTDPNDPHECKCGSFFCRGTLSASSEYSKIHERIFDTEPNLSELNQKIAEYNEYIYPFESYPEKLEIITNLNLFASELAEPIEYDWDRIDDFKAIRNILKETGQRINLGKLGFVVVGILFNDYVIGTQACP